MLADRPLHQFVTLGPTPALVDANNLGTVLSGGCVPLVDCSANDGAVIDSVSLVAHQANSTATRVVLFLSNAPTVFSITESNTAPVASAVLASSAVGERTNVALPPLSIPVPNLGGSTSPTEASKKNTGLYVAAGQVLYVGLSTVILLPTPATKLSVFAQGGFF